MYITGNQRQVENAYAYDAFGKLRGQAGELLNRILYTGQQYDQEMGQYYLRARYYNPVVGRFTQEDVYRGDGLNLYVYCSNNPVTYYDPSGYARVVPFSKGNYSYEDINAIDYNALATSYFGDPPTDMYDPHAHHIVYKVGNGAAQKEISANLQGILVDYDIDPIQGKEVLGWAPNRVKDQHSLETLDSLNKEILAVKESGGTREDIIAVLDKHKQEAANRKPEDDKEKEKEKESGCPEK